MEKVTQTNLKQFRNIGDRQIIIITGIISRKAAIKTLYHRGRLVELNVWQDPNGPQVRKQGNEVKLWGIREEKGDIQMNSNQKELQSKHE